MAGRAGPGRLPGAAVPPGGPRRCRIPVPGPGGVHLHPCRHSIACLHAHTDALPDRVRGLRQPGGARGRSLHPAAGRDAGCGQLHHRPFPCGALGAADRAAAPVQDPGAVPAAAFRLAHRGGYPGARRRHRGPDADRTAPLPAAGGPRRDRALRGRCPGGGFGPPGLCPAHGLGHRAAAVHRHTHTTAMAHPHPHLRTCGSGTAPLPDGIRDLRQRGGACGWSLHPAAGRDAGCGQLLHRALPRVVLGAGGGRPAVHRPGAVPTAVSHPAHVGGPAGARRRHPGPGPPRVPSLPAAGGPRRDRALRGRCPGGGRRPAGLLPEHGGIDGCGHRHREFSAPVRRHRHRDPARTGGRGAATAPFTLRRFSRTRRSLPGLQPAHDLGHDAGRQRPRRAGDPGPPLVRRDPPVRRAAPRAVRGARTCGNHEGDNTGCHSGCVRDVRCRRARDGAGRTHQRAQGHRGRPRLQLPQSPAAGTGTAAPPGTSGSELPAGRFPAGTGRRPDGRDSTATVAASPAAPLGLAGTTAGLDPPVGHGASDLLGIPGPKLQLAVGAPAARAGAPDLPEASGSERQRLHRTPAPRTGTARQPGTAGS